MENASHRHGPLGQGLRRLVRRLGPLGRRDREEGLAAGTGLLTGSTAEGRAPQAVPTCPHGDGTGHVVVIDLISQAITWRCGTCATEWQTVDVPVGRS